MTKQKYVHAKQVKFILLGPPVLGRTAYLGIIGLKSWAKVCTLNNPIGLITPLATIKFRNEQEIFAKHFFSQEPNNSFDDRWGFEKEVFADNRNINFDITEFNPELPENSNIHLVYVKQRRATSMQIAQLFIDQLTHDSSEFWQLIKNDFLGKHVTISYSDRYVLSKFNSMLLFQFISRFAHVLDLNIEQLELNFEPIRGQLRQAYNVWDNWNNNKERNDFIFDAVQEIENIDQESIVINDSGRAAHYRQLVIESDNKVLIIQPDGGFGQGWKYDRYYGTGNYDEIGNNDEMSVFNETGQNGIQYIVVLEN